VAVVEPYFRSLETGRRVCELARELGVRQTWAVANRLRSAGELDAVREFCARHDMRLVGEVPYDETLLAGERAGLAPIDHDPDAPAVRAIRRLAVALEEASAPR
jgi:CO dehydrogenase maturation factor